MVRIGGRLEFAYCFGFEAIFSHQPGNPFPPAASTAATKLLMDLGTAVFASAFLMDLFDHLGQRFVFCLSQALRPA